MKFNTNPYEIKFEFKEIKSPFTGIRRCYIISVYQDFGIKALEIKLNDEFTKAIFKYLIDLYSNALPFCVQIPPFESNETSCISGEYEPTIGRIEQIEGNPLYHEYKFTLAKIDSDQNISSVSLPCTLEEFNMMLEELEDIIPYEIFNQEELEDYDCIDLSYIYDHRFNRDIKWNHKYMKERWC